MTISHCLLVKMNYENPESIILALCHGGQWI